MKEVTKDTARKFKVYMADDTDPTAAKTGLTTFTVYLSKEGVAEATVTPVIVERGNGWYEITPTTAHRDTLGVNAWTFTATGAKDYPYAEEVVEVDKRDAVRMGLTAFPNANAGAENGLGTLDSNLRLPAQVKGIDADVINASSLATTAVSEIVTAMQAVADDFKATGFAVSGDAMTLTTAERTAVAVAVASDILNDGDGTAVLQAIADQIANDWVAGDSSPLAVATAVWAHATRTLTSLSAITDLGWNPAWDVEIESEVSDALVAIHLDHLFASAFDVTNPPGVLDSFLNEITEDDGSGNTRGTEKFLEEGPSSSITGGDATEAKQDLILAHFDTSTVFSLVLNAGEYCNRTLLETIFGVENIQEWANPDNGDIAEQAVLDDIDDRVTWAINVAETRTNDRLRNSRVTIPLEDISLDTASTIAGLAGGLLFEVRGSREHTGDGNVAHQLAFYQKRWENWIRNLVTGRIVLNDQNASDAPSTAPRVSS